MASANLLVAELRRGPPSLASLARVQRRRELPTRLTQSAQLRIQDGLIAPTLEGAARSVPRVARWLDQWPLLRRVPARLIGMGVRPEHVSKALRRAHQ